MASVPISTPLGFAAAASSSARSRSRFIRPAPPRNMFHPYASLDVPGKHNQVHSLSLKLSELQHRSFRNICHVFVLWATAYRKSLQQVHLVDVFGRHDAVIEAKQGNPPIMPAVMTPGGPLDLSSILFRNRIIFIGQPVNSQVAQRVISQLVTLATVDEDADILIYVNCPGGSTYSVLAIYDCMSWIKPKVGTVCFGVAASQGALLLAGGEKGMRYAMPNARIMIHQPQSGCGGHVEDVRRQVNEAVQSRHKIDKMYAAFTGQPLEKIQQYTDRDRFFSASEALEFGLIDGILETEY